jgi:hypothetical protein
MKPDTEPGLQDWLALNREYAAKWPNITSKGEPPADAKEWDEVPGKLARLSPHPHEDRPLSNAPRRQTSLEAAGRGCTELAKDGR